LKKTKAVRKEMPVKKAVWLMAALTAVLFPRCGLDENGVGSTGGDETNEMTGTTYLYTAFDTAGRVIVRGDLVLHLSDSATVTGTWDFEAVGTPSAMNGPHIGTGTLVGSIDDSIFTANLNPGMADNNVFLHGTLETGWIAGTWEFAGFPGVLNRGPFIAVRR
jgi:hypothetical protein